MARPHSDTYIDPMKSPCIKHCQIDQTSQLCLGCYRTLEEIASWASMSDGKREQIMAALNERRPGRQAG